MKFTIPAVVPVTIPVSDDHVRAYKGPDDPPLDWYKTFCSMQYNIKLVDLRWSTYELTPRIGRPVYTFDYIEEFIESTRDFTVKLFTSNLTVGVPQYRVHRSPVRVHRVYKLPPSWPWQLPT